MKSIIATILLLAAPILADEVTSDYIVQPCIHNDFEGGDIGSPNQGDCSSLINSFDTAPNLPVADSEKCLVFSDQPLIGRNCAVHTVSLGGCAVSMVDGYGGLSYTPGGFKSELQAMLNSYQYTNGGASWTTVDLPEEQDSAILCIHEPYHANGCRQLWSKYIGAGSNYQCG
ncbi:MAG: hypothetical protein MMC23_005021 [Stictis urceolatum]|nr:hypothetical protein [Stictis urceolata]